MKTITHLRPRSARTVREYDSTDAIPPGQIAVVAGVLYVRLPGGTLLEIAAGEPE